MSLPEEYYKILHWTETSDHSAPYVAIADNVTYKIRINDFPEEPLYTLLKDESPLCSFNNWPKHWVVAGSV